MSERALSPEEQADVERLFRLSEVSACAATAQG